MTGWPASVKSTRWWYSKVLEQPYIGKHETGRYFEIRDRIVPAYRQSRHAESAMIGTEEWTSGVTVPSPPPLTDWASHCDIDIVLMVEGITWKDERPGARKTKQACEWWIYGEAGGSVVPKGGRMTGFARALLSAARSPSAVVAPWTFQRQHAYD
ncbi:hypothetical protein MRB53_041808 [Persea americana]|nr:hypothetical protein MRB53_041808 [Persea americana]